MIFSQRETRDLLFAGLMISAAFAILFAGGYSSLTGFNTGLILAFVVAFFTAGIGFLFHEMMHKYVAQRYGLRAEFIASYPMLWLALLFSLFGFILAAPGAVYISGARIDKNKNGKISLAGPMTNIVIAAVFLICVFIFGNNYFLSFGLEINSLLAAFNMLPVMPFDGAKIFSWNKNIYFVTIVIAVGLSVVSWLV